MKKLEDSLMRGFGLHLKCCIRLDLGIVQYRLFRGRSYIKTLAYISPRTVMNVKNNDNRCFERAVLSAMYPVDHGQNPNRPMKYQVHLDELNFTGVSFSVRMADITKFERQNPGLSVHVFGWEAGLYPLHVSKQEGRAIELLLIADEKKIH